MTAENFNRSLKLVLKDEGGYSNDKNDPGGATMWGITHIDYDAYRKRRGQHVQDVRRMTTAERDDIYRSKYWTGARCDDLPDGVDYVVFDGAVNSGVAQSVKWLQRAISGIVVDGHAGDVTVTSANDDDPAHLITSICDSGWRSCGRCAPSSRSARAGRAGLMASARRRSVRSIRTTRTP